MASTFSDFLDHMSYTPAGGDLLLARNRHTIIYRQNDQILYGISEMYLVGFEWDQVFSFTNHTNGDVTRTMSKTLGLVVTQGSEVSAEFGLSAEFRGIGINMGASRKNFQSAEVSEVSSVQTAIICAPNKTTRFYQRLYRFRTRVWYLVDAWAELSRVGGLPLNGQPNYILTFSESRHEIKSEDYLLTHTAPVGRGTFTGSPASRPQDIDFKWTRQFNNIPKRSKNYLTGLADRGMAFISGYNPRSALIPYSIIDSSSPQVAAASDRKKSEAEGAELIGVEHPPDKSQDQIVCVSKRTSDAPPDEELPAACCNGGLASLDC